MNLKNYYYYFQSALSPRLCQEIIDYGKQHQAEMAVTGGYNRSNGQMSKKDINDLNKTYEKTRNNLESFGPRLAGRLESELGFTKILENSNYSNCYPNRM